jgi:hypothetical protein
MEQNCTQIDRPLWKGFTVQDCEYRLKDGSGNEIQARVLLADAPPERLARWVVQACIDVVNRADDRCTSRLRRQILEQSGAQFPVAGIVLEDLYAPRGKFEGYCFRDGVTVIVSGFKNGSSLFKSPSEDEIKACLNNPVVQVKRFARIQGTTVGMYKANGGLEDVGTDGKENPNWLQVVRTLYQRALNSDRNELLIAWARANRSQL